MKVHDSTDFELRERLKELRCLNEATALLRDTDRNPEDLFPALLLTILSAFQFPEQAGVELCLQAKCYQTPEYRQTAAMLRERIALNEYDMGSLTVCYSAASKADFLPEETDLLRNLALMIAWHEGQREAKETQKETIAQMENRSAKLEALLNALPDMLFVMDGEGTITDYRAGKVDDLAVPPEFFLNHKLSELFPASLSDVFLDMIGRVIAEGTTPSMEYAMQVAGETRYYETRMSRYGNRYVIALVNNITGRVHARERLVQSEERYRSLIDSSDAMVIMIDRQGTILFANAIASTFFGKPVEDLTEKKIQDLFPPDQARELIAGAHAVIESGSGKVFEQSMTSAEGAKWFRTSVQPVRGSDGKAFAVMINASDITAVKTSEEKIRRSERNYRTLFFNDPYGYMIHRNGVILECNEAAARMIKGDRSRIIGSNIYELTPEFQPNGRRSDEYGAELTATALKEGALHFEWVHKRFDGTEFLTDINLGVVEYDGEPAIITTWRDITQERKAEEDLRTFQTISDQANIGTAIASLEGKLLYVNQEFARMHGRTTDELVGQSLSMLHAERHMDDVRKVLDELRDKGQVSAVEVWHARSDGSVFPTLMNVKLIHDAKGTPQFMAASALDISDLKRKEAEIRKLTIAIEQSPAALVVTDLEGVITYVSPAFMRITGYESDEAIGKPTSILKSGQTPRSVYEDLWNTIRSGETWKGEWVNRKKNGELYTESVSISPVYDEQGNAINYIAVKEDVTINRQVEKERTARTIAEEANKAKSVFLSNMSHEIRTPLNAIIGFAQILARDETLGTRQREQVSTIARSGNHLLRLINDILDFSRIESGKTTLDPSDFDLKELLEDIRSMFNASASQKGLQLLSEWQDNVPRFVNGDEKKIRQILINVLGNAVKFTRIGGIAFRVKLNGTVENPVLKIEIEDSGPGIPEQDLDHIFESFQQSQAGKDAGGTGLGLAITRQLLDMMGGSIAAESVVGKGSLFRIMIPVRIAEKAAAETIQTSDEHLWRLRPGSPPVRILVADDIPDNRTLLRTVLEPAGFEIRETKDGVETLEEMRKWKPDAVLIDLRMPRMDGYATVRTASVDPELSGLPMIAVTASAFEEDKKTVAAAGFAGYIRKPFRPQEVLAMLRAKLNLDFELKPDDSAAKAAEKEIVPQDLEILDETTKGQLRDSLERGNMRQFRTLLDKVAQTAPQLAKSLSELARRYEYDRLNALLGKQ